MDSTQFVIDDRTQLFVDSWMIESFLYVTRRWYKPTRRMEGPVLTGNQPWESFPYFTYSNFCVLRDPQDGLYKCWYEDLGLSEEAKDGWECATCRVLYAESKDGIVWEKPLFDIALHNGKPTNIVVGNDRGHGSSAANPLPKSGVHSAAVILDPSPPRPEERFRMWFTLGADRRSVACAHSADGIHWHLYPERPSLGSSGRYTGDVSCLWYDHDSRDFVMNTRHREMCDVARPAFHICHAPFRPDLMAKRRIFQTRSHDFIHWSDPLPIATANDTWDNLEEQYYGMAQFQVGRQQFGTLGVFRDADNEMDVRLLHSRDGVNWNPTDRATPFLAPRGPGSWDAHMVSIVCPPVEHGDELRFYHGGTTGHHDYWLWDNEGLDLPEVRDRLENVRFAMGLATLRRDGFCSIDTGDVRPGRFATRPVKSGGERLHINGRCRQGGTIRVEVTDPMGAVLDGCSRDSCDVFTGDTVDHVVTWNGRETVPNAGRFRRIVFYLERAEVFSFRMA